MSTKENQSDNDPRIMIAQMNQAWSDARGYTGHIWQIAALCLTVITLSLNVVYTYSLIDSLLILIPLFATLLAAGGVFAIQWLRYNITYRVAYIQEIEEKLAEYQEEYKVTPSSHLFGLEKGPLAFLFGILVVTTEILFFSLAYVCYEISISLSMDISISQAIATLIFLGCAAPFTFYVIQNRSDLRRREKESARNWKARFSENLWKMIDTLRSEGHEVVAHYIIPIYDKSRELGADIQIMTSGYQFTFIARTSYWVSKKKWDESRAFEKQVVFIVTPHHEMFPKQRFGVIAISSAVSSKELRKYILDGIAGKLIDVEEDPLFEAK